MPIAGVAAETDRPSAWAASVLARNDKHSQDCYDPLAVAPAHLLDKFDACEEVACAAGSQEKAVVEHEVARHADCFSVAYPGEHDGSISVRSEKYE